MDQEMTRQEIREQQMQTVAPSFKNSFSMAANRKQLTNNRIGEEKQQSLLEQRFDRRNDSQQEYLFDESVQQESEIPENENEYERKIREMNKQLMDQIRTENHSLIDKEEKIGEEGMGLAMHGTHFTYDKDGANAAHLVFNEDWLKI